MPTWVRVVCSAAALVILANVALWLVTAYGVDRFSQDRDHGVVPTDVTPGCASGHGPVFIEDTYLCFSSKSDMKRFLNSQ